MGKVAFHGSASAAPHGKGDRLLRDNAIIKGVAHPDYGDEALNSPDATADSQKTLARTEDAATRPHARPTGARTAHTRPLTAKRLSRAARTPPAGPGPTRDTGAPETRLAAESLWLSAAPAQQASILT